MEPAAGLSGVNAMTYQELYDAGLAALRAQRAAEAVAPLTECTQLAPEQPDAWLFLGVAHGMLDSVDEARAALEHAGELAPNDARVLYNLGRLAQRSGDVEAARDQLRRCLALDPSNQRAREALASVEPANLGEPAQPDQVIRPTRPEGLGPLAGWVEMPALDGRAVLRMMPVLAVAVGVVSAIDSFAAAAAGGFRVTSLQLAMGTAAFVVLLQPILAGLLGAACAKTYTFFAQRFTAPRMRLEQVAGKQRLVEIDPMSAGRAMLWWSVPSLILMCLVMVAMVPYFASAASTASRAAVTTTGVLLGAVIGVVFALPISAIILYVLGLIGGLIYNLVATYTGGIEATFTPRGAEIEATDVSWQPTASTLFWCNVPLMGLMLAAMAMTAAMPATGSAGAAGHLANCVTLALSPFVRVAAYRKAQPSIGGFRFTLRPLD